MQKGCEEDENYLILDGEGRKLYACKTYIKTSVDDTTEEHIEYAKSNAELYRTAMMDDDPLTTLGLNTEVMVLDQLNDILYESYRTDDEAEPIFGFMKADSLNRVKSTISYDWNNWGDTGNVEPYIAPVPVPVPAPAPATGGYGDDILLKTIISTQNPSLVYKSCAYSPSEKYRISLCSDTVEGTRAEVFTDDLEVYAGFVEKGETVALIDRTNDENWSALMDHMVCSIPAYSVLLEGEEEPFEEFDGYVVMGVTSAVCSDTNLSNVITQIPQNSKVHVVAMIGNIYEIDVIEESIGAYGTHGYVSAEEITDTQHIWEAYGGGGDYTREDTAPSSVPVPEPVWSDFVM